MSLQLLSEAKVFGGWHRQYSHESATLSCSMRFAIFLPPQAEQGRVPVLYWLSGLTCTDENFMQKAGAFRVAAELGIAIVAPDTSPRGEQVPDDPDGAWDFGLGAGFYLNATQPPWVEHYQMYDYVLTELPELVEYNFPLTAHRAIAGHSMGGHGALVLGLRNPQHFSSISAFSPISNPSDCPWGKKAFSHYLGDEVDKWLTYDATELLKLGQCALPIRVDQGLADGFLEEQLKPERLRDAAEQHGTRLDLHQHEGYDHSYFFIASFIEEHLRFHAKYLLS